MCIDVIIFNNKDKIMTKIIFFTHFGLNIWGSRPLKIFGAVLVDRALDL